MHMQQLTGEERKLIENYRASSETNRGHLQLVASITARTKTIKKPVIYMQETERREL